MSDGSYIFNQEKMTYEKKEPRKGRKFLISAITQGLLGIMIGVVVFLTISYTIKTPRQKKIERENAAMENEYEVLSDRYTKVDSVLKDIVQRDKDIYRAIFETELGDGSAASRAADNFAAIDGERALADTVRLITEAQQKRLVDEEAAFSELKFKMANSSENLRAIPSVLPIPDPEAELEYYGFGKKLDPIYKTSEMHEGLDIAAAAGTEVVATADGTVEFVGDRQKYGQHVIINHKNGYKTVYAHLGGYVAGFGQRVKRGEVIGLVGNSGKSVAPHLHYEIQYKGKPVNPASHTFGELRPEQWRRMCAKAKSRGLSLD